MDKLRKIELIQRTLGIRHKLKVHDSMKVPDNHEDLAIYLSARWELEDELRAIDEILNEARVTNVAEKKKLFTGPNARSFHKKSTKLNQNKGEDS
jgi:hypothetical protein